ncbi:MAG: nucleoside hydrolase [Cyanobacteria bacterium P01_A01_bin.135]
MPTSPTKLILDTDPGGDDAVALLWLLSLVKQGIAELVAVTTAQGNVAAQQTFINSSRLLALAGFSHIPVGRGALPPGLGDDAAHIHGGDGMGNLSPSLPAATHDYAIAPPSEDLLIEQLAAAPGEITLVAIGPLTNLAAAEAKQPGILRAAKEIVVMGGAFGPGNVTPMAEFNIWFNPPAAQTVFDCCDNVVLLPLDVTRQLQFTEAIGQRLLQRSPDNALAQFVQKLCQFMTTTALQYREVAGTPGFLVHDAITIAYLFYPNTLTLQRACLQVETQGQWTAGQTVMDRRQGSQPGANTWVAVQADTANILASLVEDLTVLMEAGPSS